MTKQYASDPFSLYLGLFSYLFLLFFIQIFISVITEPQRPLVSSFVSKTNYNPKSKSTEKMYSIQDNKTKKELSDFQLLCLLEHQTELEGFGNLLNSKFSKLSMKSKLEIIGINKDNLTNRITKSIQSLSFSDSDSNSFPSSGIIFSMDPNVVERVVANINGNFIARLCISHPKNISKLYKTKTTPQTLSLFDKSK